MQEIFYKFKIPRSEKFVCGFCGAHARLFHATNPLFEKLNEKQKAKVLNEGRFECEPLCPHCFKSANFKVVLELYALKKTSICTLKMRERRKDFDFL
ncbi:hypothetical protein NYG92_05425 [Campylobacter felis]|uniref:hypothetical protein n=1 Tax=Campylobacter felis TaxID=2974565 RepID=UPI002562FDBE|nr:hypothetical protein [Campylobacter felis]MDL0110192.1 hypothetical protein [Campylobacter felis]